MLDSILSRRSCKAYKSDMVPEEIINKIWSIQGLDNRIYGLDNGKLLICNE